MSVCERDERRVNAALAATKDFTVEGLEEIVQKDLTLQLALQATWIMEMKRFESFAAMKTFFEQAGAEDQASRGASRGD